MRRVVHVMLALAMATSFYADPAHSDAGRFARTHHGPNAALMRKLSRFPQAQWFTGGTPEHVRHETRALVHRAKATVPVLVAYNVPRRDCGNLSAGGARNARGYRRWIDAFARGIGTHRAIVILEPDALARMCGKHRLANLRNAADRLAKLPNTRTYVDAGHSDWQPAKTMAKRLNAVHAHAYALNVANFQRNSDLVAYGHAISPTLHFVIDTSRNGRGPRHHEWCNPSGRGLGARPTDTTGDALVDYLLWVKPPGESDGSCHGAPPAGRWWPRYAIGLSRRAVPPL